MEAFPHYERAFSQRFVDTVSGTTALICLCFVLYVEGSLILRGRATVCRFRTILFGRSSSSAVWAGTFHRTWTLCEQMTEFQSPHPISHTCQSNAGRSEMPKLENDRVGRGSLSRRSCECVQCLCSNPARRDQVSLVAEWTLSSSKDSLRISKIYRAKLGQVVCERLDSERIVRSDTAASGGGLAKFFSEICCTFTTPR